MPASAVPIVVIVEDEADTAEMFAEMARLVGFQVFKSLGGRQAMALIAEKQPHVVLLDIMMPDLSGLDVLQQMGHDAGLARIPVIIISAKGLPSDIQSGLDAGAAFYLTKPVAFADFKRALEMVQRPPSGMTNQ